MSVQSINRLFSSSRALAGRLSHVTHSRSSYKPQSLISSPLFLSTTTSPISVTTKHLPNLSNSSRGICSSSSTSSNKNINNDNNNNHNNNDSNSSSSSQNNSSTVAEPQPPRLHMVFTCAKCNTRSVKSFTKNAYENGVVIVTCPGCEARHLIADNLGWFGPDDESNIEKLLAKKGQHVTRITDSDIEYVPSSKT